MAFMSSAMAWFSCSTVGAAAGFTPGNSRPALAASAGRMKSLIGVTIVYCAIGP